MTSKVLHLHRKPKVEGEFGLQKPEVEQAQITSNGIESDYNDGPLWDVLLIELWSLGADIADI